MRNERSPTAKGGRERKAGTAEARRKGKGGSRVDGMREGEKVGEAQVNRDEMREKQQSVVFRV